MTQRNLHFMLWMKYEDALEAVRTCLGRNGFVIEECQDILAERGLRTANVPGKRQELTILEADQSGGLSVSADSSSSLSRIVVGAIHGGFAEVFLRQPDEEADSSVWGPKMELTEATALKLVKAMLEAGKSAFPMRELSPRGRDSAELQMHST